MKSNIKYVAMLLTTSLLWGLAFIAQTDAAQYIGPFTFLALRTLLGSLTLIPLLFIFKVKIKDKKTIYSGIFIGVWFFLASTLQQAGISHTTVAKAGFISALCVILVPLFECMLFHYKLNIKNIICIILSIIGLFLLFKMKLSFSKGDILILISTIFYSMHMISINHSSQCDGIALSYIQFVSAMIISFICMLIFETPSINNITNATPSILYAGIVSCGIAYTLQIIGQKKVNPTVSAICLSMESFFAALFGFIILKQVLSFQEIIGCTLMLISIIVSQI